MKKVYHHKCIKCNSIFTNDIVYKSRRERICPQCKEKEVTDRGFAHVMPDIIPI